MTENYSRDLSKNEESEFDIPYFEGLEYPRRERPTGGHFDELHPFQSDWDLIHKYEELHGFVPIQYKSGFDRGVIVGAEQIRHTWGVEASTEGTLDREVARKELVTPFYRANGILLGLICGDALGRPVEFMSSEQIKQKYGSVRDMIGDGSHGQPPGTVTDDSALALRLANNIIENNGFNSQKYANQLVEWYESEPFDIGNTTRSSIEKIRNGVPLEEAGYKTLEQRGPKRAAGDGSVMRCAPLAIAYPDDLDTLEKVSIEMSEITHADPRCTYGCAALNIILAQLLREASSTPIDDALNQLSNDAPDELYRRLDGVKRVKSKDELNTSGFVLDTLETTLYIGLTSNNPEDAIIRAVNMGGDADTIAAVAGAISGAKYGGGRKYTTRTDIEPAKTSPTRWTNKIRLPDDIARSDDALRTIEIIVTNLLERPQIAELNS